MNHFTSTQFKNISIVLATHVPPYSGDPIHKNRPSHGFAYHRDGLTTYTFDNGNALTIPPNTIIYLPKNSNYTVSSDTTLHIEVGTYAINFNTSSCDINLPEFKFTPKNTEKIFMCFQDAEIAWRTKPVGYYERCCCNFYDIILNIKQEMTAKYMPNSKKSIIAPALDYIRENYTYENISITKLSKLCGISEVYMRKIFQQVFGMSPIKYINQMKLLRAKELIQSGEYNVGEVALLSGFFNDSYFSREFKKEFGISPTDYYKSNRLII